LRGSASRWTAAPAWLELARHGDLVCAYYRQDETDPWTLLGLESLVGLAPQVESSLAVTSHVDGTLATATFSDVSVRELPSWSAAAVGIGSSDGQGSFDDTFFGVFNRGADIWGRADAFTYVYTPLSGDGSIVARVRSIDAAHAWTKAGVMIRESLGSGSRQVDAVVAPGKGIAMQYRDATSSASATAGGTAGTAPGWVRLTRRGDAVSAEWSLDHQTWTPLGTATMPLPANVLVGLAVTSHNASAMAGAVFDDVVVTAP